MTSYSVTFAGFLLLSGRMADVLGRRLVFALGVELFTAAALGGALAPNAGVLIVARALQRIRGRIVRPSRVGPAQRGSRRCATQPFGQRPLLIGGFVLIALGIASWMWTSMAGNYWLQMLPSRPGRTSTERSRGSIAHAVG